MDSATIATPSNEKDNDLSFRFIVTGFGPFNGVPDNPTSILVKKLPGYLQMWAAGEESNDAMAKILCSTTETMIVETSAQAAKQEIAKLQAKLEPYASAIVLHLGVDAGGQTFKLERCAYNDATFRVPDERGYRPDKAPVIDTCAVGATLTTTFDVPGLVDTMNQTLSTALGSSNSNGTLLAHPSTDPGRFVCNYIYCTSMDAFRCAQTVPQPGGSPPRVQSLFLHVPPFEAVPEAEQMVFVSQLMKALYEQKHAATVQVPST